MDKKWMSYSEKKNILAEQREKTNKLMDDMFNGTKQEKESIINCVSDCFKKNKLIDNDNDYDNHNQYGMNMFTNDKNKINIIYTGENIQCLARGNTFNGIVYSATPSL